MRFGLMQTKVGMVSLLSKYQINVSKNTPIPLVLTFSTFFPIQDIFLLLGLYSRPRCYSVYVLSVYIYIYIYSAKQCITYLFLSSYTAFFIITLSTTAVTVCHSGCRLSMWSTYRVNRVDWLETLYCNDVIIFTRLWVYHLN